MNRRRWLGLSLAGIASAGALGALVASPALGGGPRGFFGHGPRWGHHGRQLDPAQVREHVEWMLRKVDASEAQVDEITRIATGTMQELKARRGERRAAHGQIVAALSGATVDRAALEALRAEHVAAADAASRRVTDAIAQAAEVLTPEQRSALAEQHAAHLARVRELHGAE